MISIRSLALALVLSLAPLGAAVSAEPPVPAAAATAPVATSPQAVAKAKPDETQAKLDGWKNEIDQISAGVQREGQSDRRLAELRERADAIRSAADDVDRAESPRAAAIEARLKQLGPAPVAKEGEPEPVEAEAVKTEREDQQKLLAEAQGRVKQAQLLKLRADEIAKAIAEKRRARFAEDMAQRSRSVVEPSVWYEAAASMPGVLAGLLYLLRDWFSLLGREALVALLLGSTMAVAIALIGYVRGDATVSLVLALSMMCVVMIGSVIGMSLPFVLSKVGFDPATASAPLITSISDASGVLIYLFIASKFLPIG